MPRASASPENSRPLGARRSLRNTPGQSFPEGATVEETWNAIAAQSQENAQRELAENGAPHPSTASTSAILDIAQGLASTNTDVSQPGLPTPGPGTNLVQGISAEASTALFGAPPTVVTGPARSVPPEASSSSTTASSDSRDGSPIQPPASTRDGTSTQLPASAALSPPPGLATSSLNNLPAQGRPGRGLGEMFSFSRPNSTNQLPQAGRNPPAARPNHTQESIGTTGTRLPPNSISRERSAAALPSPSSNGMDIDDDKINGFETEDGEATFIGWCNRRNKRRFHIINAHQSNEQYAITKSRENQDEANYIGVKVDSQGYFRIGSRNRGYCWEDIIIKGACFIEVGSNAHIYYMVTWPSLPNDRYAIAMGELCQLRKLYGNERRVGKAEAHEEVRTWAESTRNVSGYCENFFKPYQLMNLFDDRRELAVYVSRGPRVGRDLSQEPESRHHRSRSTLTGTRSVSSSNSNNAAAGSSRATQLPSPNSNDFISRTELTTALEAFQINILAQIGNMLQTALQGATAAQQPAQAPPSWPTVSPATQGPARGGRGGRGANEGISRRLGEQVHETDLNNLPIDDLATMVHLRDTGLRNEFAYN
ncbi:hypothetical protein TWF192_005768 [Orbilia oligospora]|uniref:Uncharacterized protein n=1 Tax=Orbilia oligospora TaxID=2813651 RepID=A0A6G1MNA9_ORBOL|nr:hypothetical protein TWF191_003873 [Orbilia oligospora]KAF3263487.1 hypothetical protein TWF192_005768 [Orbilia oligospora]